MHAPAKSRKSKSAQGKAVTFGQCQLVTDHAKLTISLAQDHQGKFYACYRLHYAADLKLKDEHESLTPSVCPKFSTEAEAVEECLIRTMRILEARQELLVKSNLAGKAQLLDPLGAMVEKASTSELVKQCLAGKVSLETGSKSEVGTGKSDAPKSPSSDLPSPNSDLLPIPLEKLHDHPGNPDPSENEILTMTQWLLDEKQQEPLTVRERPDDPDRYEVLAGKTRLAAARRLGWSELLCRVRNDLADDAAAARFAMKNNVMRREENPLRKIRWAAHYIEQGLGNVKDAGEVYGWSETHTRSMLGLLKLPAEWLSRVEAGEIAPTVAIRLNPFAEVKPVMAQLSQWWKEAWRRKRMCEKDGIAAQIAAAVAEATRPIETGVKRDYGYSLGHDHPRLFKLTNTDETHLQIVSLPIGKNGKLMRVALNTKAYDALQIPLIKEKLAAAKSGGGKKGTKAKGKPQDKLTPAQAKKEAERKRKEADEQLATRLIEWRHRMLRLGIAQLVTGMSSGNATLMFLAQWATSACTELSPGSYSGRAPLAQLKEIARMIVNGKREPLPYAISAESLYDSLARLDSGRDDDVADWQDFSQSVLQLILWPRLPVPSAVAQVPGDGIGSFTAELPWGTHIPLLPHHTIEAIAKRMGISLADEWKRGAGEKSQQREMIEVFLQLHNREQLNDLAAEICISRQSPDARPLPAMTYVKEQKTKTAAIEALLSLHTKATPLKAPSCLAPPARAAKSKRKK